MSMVPGKFLARVPKKAKRDKRKKALIVRVTIIILHM